MGGECCSDGLRQMTKAAALVTYVKDTLKIFFATDLKTLFVTFGPRALQSLFKWRSHIDLGLIIRLDLYFWRLQICLNCGFHKKLFKSK